MILKILQMKAFGGGLQLTLYTLTSVCTLSILFSKHFLGCRQGEFVSQSRASEVGVQFLYTPDLNVCFRGDMVRRNLISVTLRSQRRLCENLSARSIRKSSQHTRIPKLTTHQDLVLLFM